MDYAARGSVDERISSRSVNELAPVIRVAVQDRINIAVIMSRLVLVKTNILRHTRYVIEMNISVERWILNSCECEKTKYS